MGTGFKGGASYHHTISENLTSLKKSYVFTDGYFGDKGEGRSFTRNIASENPSETAKDFFDKAAYGGLVQHMSNGKGKLVKMKDGSIVSHREISTSDGSPAVEINITRSEGSGGIKKQKIHFVKE